MRTPQHHCDDTLATDSNQNQFLSLPNELLSMLFKWLGEEDRKSLGSINERLEALEIKAGYRNFAKIEFSTEGAEINVWDDLDIIRTFKMSTPDDAVAEYFKHATTGTLSLTFTDRVDEATERKLLAAFKTVYFKKLRAEMRNESSAGILQQLVRNRMMINEVDISSSSMLKNNVKSLLLALPPMKTCQFNILSIPVIDDEVLLHVVNNCSHMTGIFCLKSGITAKGLARSFENVLNSSEGKEVYCCTSPTEVTKFLETLDGRFVKTNRRVDHIQSGANLKLIHRELSGHWYIRIRMPRKTV